MLRTIAPALLLPFHRLRPLPAANSILACLLLMPYGRAAIGQGAETSKPAFAGPMYVRQVPVDCSDLAYDQVAHRLYASLPSTFGPTGNSIVVIDHVTGAVGKPVAVGPEPATMAASSDGKYLYVVLKGSRSICRYDIHAQKPDLTFPLNGAAAAQICVSPGNSDRIALVRQKSVSGGPAIALFDKGVELTTGPGGARAASLIGFNTDGTRLFGYNSSDGLLSRWSIGPSGWVDGGEAAGQLPGGQKQSAVFVNGLLYAGNGQVFDPDKKSELGKFPDAGGSPVQDLKNGRILFFRRQDDRCVVSAYDPQTYSLTGQTAYPKISGEPASVQVCGDVLAFRSGGRIVLIGPTPGLIDACKTHNWSQAFAAIEENVNVNCQDETGATALMWSAFSGQTALCSKLLAKGADVRTKDSRGATVLHFAVNTGNVELVQMLLRKGADPNAAASFGTPLKVASDRRRPDIVHLLQQYGAR